MASPPEWIQELANRVAALMTPYGLPAPVACHFFHAHVPKNQWEVTLFTAKTETVGGSFDGGCTSTPMALDLEKLVGLFDEVESYHWQSLRLGQEDELGPHVSIEGYYEGHYVWLRVLSEAPERFGCGRKLFVTGCQTVIEDLW